MCLADSRKHAKPRPLDPNVGAQLEGEREQLLRHNRSYQRNVRRVLAAQRKLQQHASEKAWQAYLDLEETDITRWTKALDVVLAWAYLRGRRDR